MNVLRHAHRFVDNIIPQSYPLAPMHSSIIHPCAAASALSSQRESPKPPEEEQSA